MLRSRFLPGRNRTTCHSFADAASAHARVHGRPKAKHPKPQPKICTGSDSSLRGLRGKQSLNRTDLRDIQGGEAQEGGVLTLGLEGIGGLGFAGFAVACQGYGAMHHLASDRSSLKLLQASLQSMSLRALPTRCHVVQIRCSCVWWKWGS